MAVLSTLRSTGRKPQKKNIPLFSTLKKYFLCYPKCNDEDMRSDQSKPENDVIVISLDSQTKGAKTSVPNTPSTSSAVSSAKTLPLTNANWKTDESLIFSPIKKSSGKKTLPPLDPIYTKQAQSFLDQALTGETSQKVNIKKDISLVPKPKLIKVAEAPIENRVPFQPTSKQESQSFENSKQLNLTYRENEQQEKKITINPEPTIINDVPAPAKKRVQFQLPPSLKIIPSRHSREAVHTAFRTPPCTSSVQRFLLSSDRAAVLRDQDKTIQKAKEINDRPHTAHLSKIRSRIMNAQKYNQDNNNDSESEDVLPRPLTRRAFMMSLH